MNISKNYIKSICIIIPLFFFGIIHGQDTIVIYFNIDWQQCNKENATYYREYFKNESKKYEVKDFFMSGQIQMKGTFKKRNWKEKDGHFIYYHENGQKESEGNYINDEKNGIWTYWYENGSLDSKGEFINGKYKDTWNWYFKNGQVSAKEKYNDGERIEWEFWDETGKSVDLAYAEYMPQFEGGQDSLQAFILNNTKYPEFASKQGIKGRVIVGFTVDSDGNIVDIKIRNEVHSSLANEALRVVRQLPKFIPGKQHNRIVKVSYNLPINFGH